MQLLVELARGAGLALALFIALLSTWFAVRILFFSPESNMRMFRIDPNSIEKRPRMPK